MCVNFQRNEEMDDWLKYQDDELWVLRQVLEYKETHNSILFPSIILSIIIEQVNMVLDSKKYYEPFEITKILR